MCADDKLNEDAEVGSKGTSNLKEFEGREILQFLREENDKNRAALRDDADANRKLLTTSITWVSIPLSILIAVAGAFGWRSVTSLKASFTQIYTDEVKRVMPKALEDGSKEAKNETKAETEKAIRDTVKTALSEESTKKNISDAVKNSEQLKKSIGDSIADQMALIQSQVEGKSRENAASEPFIVRGADLPHVTYSDHHIVAEYSVQNGGQQDARGIVVYSATNVANSDQDRLGVFSDLASAIHRIRHESPAGVTKESLPYLNKFTITAQSNGLPASDIEAIRNGTKSFYVLFYLDYRGADGNNGFSVFCDSWSGDLQEGKRCPSGGLKGPEAYRAIIQGK